MAVGIFPAHKDSNDDWRFGIMTDEGVKPVHYDMGEMENGGMLELRFRAVLAERHLSPCQVDQAVEGAKDGKPWATPQETK